MIKQVLRPVAALAAVLLLSGCYILGGSKTDCSTDPCSRAEFAVLKGEAPGEAAFNAGVDAGLGAVKEANKTARADFSAASARERELDARIAALEARTAETVSYDKAAQTLLAAMAEGGNPPSEEFPIAGADKSAIKDVVRQRRAGLLTDAQARDALLPFISKYQLGE